MNKNLLLLAALALPISACAGDETDEVATVVDTDADPMAADPMADPMATGTMAGDVTVDGTIAAAGSDLTALPVADATANIDGWIAKLGAPDVAFDQKDGIVNGLNELKAELAAMPLDGAAIGETLADLGDLTTESAATASTSSQEGLRTLGGALSAAGAKLGGSSM